MYTGIRQALDNILNNITKIPDADESCVELIQRYFCDYYFPSCNPKAGDIIPVCNGSCNLMYHNEDCMNVLFSALDMLRKHRPQLPVPDNSDACERNFIRFNTSDPPVAANCRFIDGIIIVQF